jgi:spore coat protein U-like protein
MLRGPYTLNYNLYTTASRTTVWGDGTGGTSTLNGLAFGATHTVYATVPARQNVRVGQYTDNIIVTLTF